MRIPHATVKDLLIAGLLVCVLYFVLRQTGTNPVTASLSTEGSMESVRVNVKPPMNPRLPRSEYHRYWDVNCSAVFADNKTEIQRVSRSLRQERARAPLMPADSTVATWTQDCSVYKNRSGYPKHALSEEEASFPIAYIILVHKSSAQVERLLRAIYQPQNIYCIHPDPKSPPDFQRAIAGLAKCFDNVFIASKLEDIVYSYFPRLLADINCMRDLTGPSASGYHWKYLINSCGQDFPLKTNLEIVRQMKAHDGHNDIMSFLPPEYKIKRTKYSYAVQNKKVVNTNILKAPAPNYLQVFTGSAYYAVTRDFVNYVLTNPTAIALLDWTKDTLFPDETFWATLQRAKGVPGGDGPMLEIVRNSARLFHWQPDPRWRCRGTYVRGICILTIGDLPYVRKQPQLFANKFYYENDPVALQCLEEDLDLRARHPEESDELLGFPMRY